MTRCQPPWRVKFKHSRAQIVLVSTLTLLSLFAVISTPLSVYLHIPGCAAVLVLGIFRLRSHPHHATITHDEHASEWHLSAPERPSISGTLVHAGYRSAWVLVLAIETESLAYHRVCVWRDQLSPQAFSYLHHQIQFNAAPRKRRAWSIPIRLRTSA